MAAGFFKNIGADVRQLVESSIPEVYKRKFVFLDKTFKYIYTRSNNRIEEQIYTYDSLMKELQKNNINIIDVNIYPTDPAPIFGVLRLTCFFKNEEKKPIIILAKSRNIEILMGDYSSKDIKI